MLLTVRGSQEQTPNRYYFVLHSSISVYFGYVTRTLKFSTLLYSNLMLCVIVLVPLLFSTYTSPIAYLASSSSSVPQPQYGEDTQFYISLSLHPTSLVKSTVLKTASSPCMPMLSQFPIFESRQTWVRSLWYLARGSNKLLLAATLASYSVMNQI